MITRHRTPGHQMRTSQLVLVLFFLLMVCTAQIRASERNVANQILSDTGVKGGLIVHIDCGDGQLTAALCAGDGFLVHGLDTDIDNVEQAREHIRSLNLYGKVSVEAWDGKQLPYIDNLVNLIV